MGSVLDSDEIVDYIRDKAGDLGLFMCQLIEQGIVSIADLAETLKMPRRATRQVIYTMNKERIVYYERTREESRIVFHWFITPKKIRRAIYNNRRRDIRKLEEELKFEQDHKFFECVSCSDRYLYTEAFDFEFMCEHCGEPLTSMDNDKLIETLRREIDELVAQEKLSAKEADEVPEEPEPEEELKEEDLDPDIGEGET